MTIPRDLSGERLAKLLKPYGYQVTRQTGSHLRLTSSFKGKQHHITIPNHKNLRIGTLHSIIYDIARYLQKDSKDFQDELFKCEKRKCIRTFSFFIGVGKAIIA